MQCHFCAGEMKKGKTTYTLNRMGYHLLIFGFKWSDRGGAGT